MRRRSASSSAAGRLCALLCALIVLVLLPSLVASPADAAEVPPDEASLAPESGAYFGVGLDWSIDTAAQQAQRLGAAPAVLEHATAVPVTSAEEQFLEQFLRQAEGVGALPAITLRPTGDLADFDEAAADAVVAALAEARGDSGVPVYVRFAPDMNATWVAWGQRPTSFVDAFRLFADAVHDDLPGAVTVWSPSAGEGYPFDAGSAMTDAALDTDGNGRLARGDDPYGPYFPGADYVDWVGLSAYHDPSDGGRPVNELPIPGELDADVGGAGDLDFYGRFAVATNTPMMLETAAFYAPGSGGASGLAIKSAWWEQVIASASESARPLLDVVMWHDSSSTRAVVGEVAIDWRISNSASVASAFRADADRSDLVFGPAYEPIALTSTAGSGVTLSSAGSLLVVALALALAVVLTLWGLVRLRIGRQGYTGPPDRDLRIDLLRGVAIVFVVVNHIALISLLQNATQEAIGMVSGAELFVLLSGAVLAMVYRPKVVGGGIGEVTLRTARRAWKLYLTALVLVLIIGAVSLIAFVNSTPVTSYVDQGTGAAGSEASGRVYDLFANFDSLLSYPVDPSIIVDLALLRLGPWQVNVLGLYVVMLLISPLVMWALSRRRWLIVLAVSGAIYASQIFLPVRVFPSQFEDSFPILTWQVLFVTGMVAGFYRREILAWFVTRSGQVVLAASIVCTVALALLSWNNPYVSSSYDLRLGLVPPNTFSSIYAVGFERTSLDPGRLVNVLLVTITAYAVLSAFWKPVNRLLGWFFVPLGQATLYVFVMHVFFVLIVANVPVLREGSILINSLAYVAILGLLWVMVKKRFLFGVVPR